MKSPKRIAPFDPRLDRAVNSETRLRKLRFDPRFEGGSGLVARDERVAGRGAVVDDHVPEPLRVDEKARALVQRDARLGGTVGKTVGTGVHQQHVAVGIVGQLEPQHHDPTRGRGIESVVVVAVEAPEREVVFLWFELDGTDSPEVGADTLYVS